jgi:uncharacterized membrane protein AbrB (regulator of aidB expression)
MMVLALALNLDPIYVGAHHLLRFLVVSLAIAFSAPPHRRAQERAGRVMRRSAATRGRARR